MKHDAYTMSLLLDYYGALLTPKQRNYFDLYYNQDLSLAEIAQSEGVSRQGVHDAVGRAEALLLDFERAAGCVARRAQLRDAAGQIAHAAGQLAEYPDEAVRNLARTILSAVSTVKE